MARKKIVSALVLMFGFLVMNNFGQKNQTEPCNLSEQGTGLAIDNVYDPKNIVENKPKIYPVGTKPLQLISKPIAKYTEEARQNCIQGKVLLRITFFSNGKVGNFKILDGLPFGLSEKAIDAAKLIKFKPEIKNGKLKTVTRKVIYNFTIY